MSLLSLFVDVLVIIELCLLSQQPVITVNYANDSKWWAWCDTEQCSQFPCFLLAALRTQVSWSHGVSPPLQGSELRTPQYKCCAYTEYLEYVNRVEIVMYGTDSWNVWRWMQSWVHARYVVYGLSGWCSLYEWLILTFYLYVKYICGILLLIVYIF